MAGTILKKKIGNHTYYYYVVSKRIKGKPGFAQQTYLGNAEQLLERKTNPDSKPVEATYFHFGLPCALYQLASELGLVNIINSYAQSTSPNLDVGQYIVLAAINRVCEPKSKRGIRKWYERTILPQLFSITTKNATSQKFWDAMEQIDIESVPKIEERLWTNILDKFKIPLDVLLYDTTNFFNYMSETTESELSQRGKNKASKDHLRQIGLAAGLVRGLGVPLIHELYNGAKNDASLFPTAISNLVKRIKGLTDKVEGITLVFDKGNNSVENIEKLEKEDLHFIGTLKPSQYPELCKIRVSRYEESIVGNGKKVLYYDTKIKVMGKKKRVVLTYNEKNAKKKKIQLDNKLGKVLTKLNKVNWSKVVDIEAKKKEIIKEQHLPSNLLIVNRVEEDVKIAIDKKSLREYEARFGKQIHFTDREDIKALEVIEYYRDKYEVENMFKDMNDPDVSPLRPIYHWTDQKITIHEFICVLGLLLIRLLQHKAEKIGATLSVEILKDELQDLNYHVVVSSVGHVFQIITKTVTALQKRLFVLFELDKLCERLDIQPP